MAPRQYHFITQWQIEAPLAAVWVAIHDSERWPRWWIAVKEVVELTPGNERGIGSIRAYTIVSPIGYRIKFYLTLTELRDECLLQGKATGDLEGVGAWHFKQEGTMTLVTIHWQVATTIRWMNALAPLLAPVFRLNHSLVMRNGLRGLRKMLPERIK